MIPVIFAEYAMDTAGHVGNAASPVWRSQRATSTPRPRHFYAVMDAANVDLKAFTGRLYVHQTGAHLAPFSTPCSISATTRQSGWRSPIADPGLNDSIRS